MSLMFCFLKMCTLYLLWQAHRSWGSCVESNISQACLDEVSGLEYNAKVNLVLLQMMPLVFELT